jgi:hypothetical protein
MQHRRRLAAQLTLRPAKVRQGICFDGEDAIPPIGRYPDRYANIAALVADLGRDLNGHGLVSACHQCGRASEENCQPPSARLCTTHCPPSCLRAAAPTEPGHGFGTVRQDLRGGEGVGSMDRGLGSVGGVPGRSGGVISRRRMEPHLSSSRLTVPIRCPLEEHTVLAGTPRGHVSLNRATCVEQTQAPGATDRVQTPSEPSVAAIPLRSIGPHSHVVHPVAVRDPDGKDLSAWSRRMTFTP